MNGKKFDIEWHSIVRDIIRNIWVILCIVVIGLSGSYVATHSFFSPEYTSSASLIVNSAAGKANAVATLSQSMEIAKIYSEVFVQQSMKEKVCENLQTSVFDGKITAKVNEGTNIMDVSVTASNPIVAYREISAILKVYPELTSSLFSNGVVTVLKTPVVPKVSSNSMTSLNYVSISVICFIAGIALIAVLSIMRDTIKDAKSFREKIDASLVGIIPHEKKHLGVKDTLMHKKKSILIYETAYTSLKFTENFNKIASKIQYLNQTKGAKVFCITSVAENEGKSTVSANIAISLALRGNKVLLVDFDGKKPALYKVFEQEYDRKAEIGDVISGKLDEKDFYYRTYKDDMHLYFAFNAKYHGDYAECIESGAVKEYIDTVKEKMDYVIVDTAPLSADTSVTGIARICDATYVVVRTDSVYSSVINDCLLTLTRTGAKIEGCILNDEQTEFNVFGQLGVDESGYYSYKKYGKYRSYGNYGRYGSYGRYGKYNKYSSYGKYSGYGKYSKYGKYSYYGNGNKGANPGAPAPLKISPEDLSAIDIKENDNGGNV